MRAGRGVSALALLTLALACGAVSTPAPVGEVLVIVDTDMPQVLASRLRVDTYDVDGTWRSSRDLPRGKPGDWPTSFGIALPDGTASLDVLLRLRAYPDGQTRDYRGERYQERPTGGDPLSPATIGDPTDMPRLLDANGNDITPPGEPLPLLSVDRLVGLHLDAGVVGAARITLNGTCAGTMVDLRDPGNPLTCVDTENVRSAPGTEVLDPDTELPTTSVTGTFASSYAQPCTVQPRTPGTVAGIPLHDDELCVLGGPFPFGSEDGATGTDQDDVPARIAVVPSFLMDRYEVTVGRFRAAVSSGFSGGLPTPNEGPAGDASTPGGSLAWCTWSAAPRGREEDAVNCMTPEVARAFCSFAGGALPLEVEWEYAASFAGRGYKTHYPWGDGDGSDPSCQDVAYNRAGTTGPACGWGVASVTYADHAGGDVTAGGIVDLGANVQELVAEHIASFGSNCWAAASLVLPTCSVSSGYWVYRGASWEYTAQGLPISSRRPVGDVGIMTGGFRCVRSGGVP